MRRSGPVEYNRRLWLRLFVLVTFLIFQPWLEDQECHQSGKHPDASKAETVFPPMDNT